MPEERTSHDIRGLLPGNPAHTFVDELDDIEPCSRVLEYDAPRSSLINRGKNASIWFHRPYSVPIGDLGSTEAGSSLRAPRTPVVNGR